MSSQEDYRTRSQDQHPRETTQTQHQAQHRNDWPKQDSREHAWQDFQSYAAVMHPGFALQQEHDQPPALDLMEVRDLVYASGFAQTLLDYARENFDRPDHPDLRHIMNQVSQHAGFGEEPQRVQYETTEQVNVADNAQQFLNAAVQAGWNSPDGRIPFTFPAFPKNNQA